MRFMIHDPVESYGKNGKMHRTRGAKEDLEQKHALDLSKSKNGALYGFSDISTFGCDAGGAVVRCGWCSGAVRVVQWCGAGGAVVRCGWCSGAVRVVRWCGAGGAVVGAGGTVVRCGWRSSAMCWCMLVHVGAGVHVASAVA